ncbi:MAG: PorV/PorQ family protein [Rikenellaceae bacterium]|jgi:hypothetical protein|nr:PorV/PorQ family protein [Rikenellaceae bacterium]
MNAHIKILIALSLATFTAVRAEAQVGQTGIMPFLGMETGARVAGTAGAGVSLADNPMALYNNAATSLIGEGKVGAGVFAGPLASGLKTRSMLYGATGFYRLSDSNSILAGVRYLAGAPIEMMDEQGFPAGVAHSTDLSVDVGYARRVGKNFVLSLSTRWIMSDYGFGDPTTNGFAFDLGAVYSHSLGWVEGASWTLGGCVADVGPHVKSFNGAKYSLPGRAAIGGSLALPFSYNHALVCALDLDYKFQPTNILGVSLGAEYTFLGHGVIRAGAHLGSPKRGIGSYATFGCGFIAGSIHCDVAWRAMADRSNPLNNTFIVSVGFLL